MYREFSDNGIEKTKVFILERLSLLSCGENYFEIMRLDDDSYEDYNDKLVLNRQDFDELYKVMAEMKKLLED